MTLHYHPFSEARGSILGYSESWNPWVGAEILYDCEGFAILAQVVDGTDKIQLMITCQEGTERKEINMFGLKTFLMATPAPIDPSQLSEFTSIMQSIVLRLVELRAGGWVMHECYGTTAFGSNMWHWGAVGTSDSKQIKGFHHKKSWKNYSTKKSMRKLKVMLAQLSDMADSTGAAKVATRDAPLMTNQEWLEQAKQMLAARESEQLAQMAITLLPELSTLDILRCCDEAERMMKEGLIKSPVQALQNASKQLEATA